MRPHHNRTSIQHWCSSLAWSDLSLYLVLWSVKVRRTCQLPRASKSNESCSYGLADPQLGHSAPEGSHGSALIFPSFQAGAHGAPISCNCTPAAGSTYLARKEHQDADDGLLSHSGHRSSTVSNVPILVRGCQSDFLQ